MHSLDTIFHVQRLVDDLKLRSGNCVEQIKKLIILCSAVRSDEDSA